MRVGAAWLAAALLAFVPLGLAATAEAGRARITPARPIAELREAVRRVSPPPQPPGLRAPELVELVALEPTIRLDLRYGTDDNLFGTRLYERPRAFLQRPAAEALVRVHRSLAGEGLGLLVLDAYRPWSITWMLWHATPPELRGFVANPARGSRHNRGAAVDLTLFRRESGEEVEMPSGYDELSERAHIDWPGGTREQRRLRALLRTAMEAEGFAVLPHEWWHYDHRDWRLYPVLDIPLEEVAPATPAPSAR